MTGRQILREAAADIRAKAKAATPGPWTPFHAADDFGDAWHVDGDNGSTTVCDAGPPLVGGRQDAEHIASWHPMVALAMADWLDDCADRWHYGPSSPEKAHATNIARAYLGRDA